MGKRDEQTLSNTCDLLIQETFSQAPNMNPSKQGQRLIGEFVSLFFIIPLLCFALLLFGHQLTPQDGSMVE